MAAENLRIVPTATCQPTRGRAGHFLGLGVWRLNDLAERWVNSEGKGHGIDIAPAKGQTLLEN